jgi:hypothetical protein
MAKRDINPDLLAKKTFLITVIGAILYISAVFAFVIGGNRREEAQEEQGQLADPAHAVPTHAEHQP